MQSCDHHDEALCVPDNRSRKRMLEQFAVAAALGMAVQDLTRFGVTINLFDVTGQPAHRPTVTVDLDMFTNLWLALRAWRDQQPKGDDLTPPLTPRGAEIRVPPEGDAGTEETG